MQRRFTTFLTCSIHLKVAVISILSFQVFFFKKKSCMYFEINEISCDFGLSGRVKNPQFLNEVASACSKEDHIVVVSCLLSWVIY